jgi:hypothetical protein
MSWCFAACVLVVDLAAVWLLISAGRSSRRVLSGEFTGF